MKKLTAILISIALVAVGAIFVIGQTKDMNKEGRGFVKGGDHLGQDRHGKGGGKGMGMMLRGLDLTDAQKAQVKAIHEANFESTKSLREQMEANHDQLETATAGGAFNESQVQEIAQKQGALHAQMIVAREKVKSQVFAILTDEQKAKAAEMKARFEQKRADRKAKMAERKAAKVPQE
jgi:periplasmic protein CpxP/Spy